MQSHQYQIRSNATDQLLKAGTIRVQHTYRKNFVGKSFNRKTVDKKLRQVSETHNIPVTELTIFFYDMGV